jgi:hypothetical protein
MVDQALERVAILENAGQQRDKNLNEFIAEVELSHWARAIEVHQPVVHGVRPEYPSGADRILK